MKSELIEQIDSGLNMARKRHPRAWTSTHHALGVIQEEVREFSDEVRSDHDGYSLHDRHKEELIDVIVACVRALEDIPEREWPCGGCDLDGQVRRYSGCRDWCKKWETYRGGE